SVTRVELSVVDGGNLHAVAIAVLAPGGLYQAGATSSLPSLGPGAELQTCNTTTTCFACAALPGCGWCDASSACMAVGPQGRDGAAPAFGDCPADAWAEQPGQCVDPCLLAPTCDTCLAASGCGWCSSSCACRSMAGGPQGQGPVVAADAIRLLVTAAAASCPAASFVTAFPSSGTCGAAGGQLCPTTVSLEAVATVTLSTANGAPVFVLDGSDSSPCITCAALGCGQGSCHARGSQAWCECSAGYSGGKAGHLTLPRLLAGSDCGIAPGPCHGVSCSGNGLCTAPGGAVACACRPAFYGADCSSGGQAGRKALVGSLHSPPLHTIAS
ncbi:hypothetical protein QJQ45_019602, partial [Haematococcus lacustris]